ncbi:hypothetical protein EWB00_002073 [Schistosoma japonicum]|uniref:Uncharacterized protein n=1 Tax=Schistosoma japonicum TaxID=6182 RepID=A0A4Z2DDF7_SCHJA|nr:hypothetical protein EWB00_002073 [Schistosoma japonicum]
MVMQRYSEPSSPNPNDSDNFNDIAGNHETLSGWNNFPLNDISTEDDEGDVISTTSIPVTNIQSIGCDNTTVDADGGSFSLQIDVDHLLNRHLNRTEFEPRGVFTASNLCTNVSEDSSHIELWNRNTPASTSQITITPGKLSIWCNISLSTLDEADKIKMCMSNFHLPISRYPTWATQIPEELWKAKLLEKIEHNAKT